MSETTTPSPAVSATTLGLAAFSLNLFIIAFSFTGRFPPALVPLFLASGIAFGLVEMWVGTHEFRIGSGFTGLVFGSFGAFWVATSLLFLLVNARLLNFGASFQQAMGLYFLAWTVLTLYLWAGSAYANMIAFIVFTVLMAALVLFDLWGFGVAPVQPGAWVGVTDAILAFYMSAALLLNDMAGRTVLPIGPSVVSLTRTRGAVPATPVTSS
ncbi:MAG TPA: acetate uptake transporter [Streptosporangiaceae bacterium]